MTVRRSLARVVVLAGLLSLTASATPVQTNRARPINGAIARYDALRPPEVRLRKLHLVRPDLIPYPIEYEVVC